ncbi:hypothetical protein CGRA01v4_11597 [Colletotrichum graminicola]|nr:hypothetical protein CGRA01v4_11597 [Colletotrichum graminicola]
MQRINPPPPRRLSTVPPTETVILRIRPDTRQPALSCSDPSPPGASPILYIALDCDIAHLKPRACQLRRPNERQSCTTYEYLHVPVASSSLSRLPLSPFERLVHFPSSSSCLSCKPRYNPRSRP